MDDHKIPVFHDMLVGCCGFGGPVAAYVARLPLVEYQQTFIMPPREGVLRRLRQRAPAPFVFTIKACQLITHPSDTPGYRRLTRPLSGELHHYGLFRPTEEVSRAWAATLKAARLLQAHAVVFETPPSFTPTARHREWMRRFFTAMPREDGLWMAWEPRGVWQTEEIAALCRELDLVPVIDPMAETDPALAPDGRAYFKVRALGNPGGLDRATLSWLAEDLVQQPSALCLMQTPNQFREANHLLQALEQQMQDQAVRDEEGDFGELDDAPQEP